MPIVNVSPPLPLDLEHFPDNVVTYGNNNTNETSTVAGLYGRQFHLPGTSVKYVENVTESLIHEGHISKTRYNLHYILAASFVEDKDLIKGRAHFNNQPYHSPGISLAAIYNSLVKYYKNESYSIKTVNHPLPQTANDKMNNEMVMIAFGFSISFNIMFGMSFLASSFVLFLIRERAIKAKHSQFVSGVHSLNFWLSTFTWDFINFLIPCVLLILTFAAFSMDAYTVDGHWLMILLLFALYGWAMLPFMYLLSFIFNVPSAGFVWLTMFNILSGWYNPNNLQ